MPSINKTHLTPHFEKQFNKLSSSIQKIALKKLALFSGNPNHPGLRTHKLGGSLKGFWSFSIDDNFRVLFRFLKNHEVIFYDIDTHEIYR